MIRWTVVAVLCGLTTSAAAGEWALVRVTPIDANGTRPCVAFGTVAYTDGNGGATMFYDGLTSYTVFGPDARSYEPTNAGGAVAWRNLRFSPTRNDIFYWDGSLVDNVSNSPVLDSAPAGANNGDIIWSRDHATLWYYDASTGQAVDLNIPGDQPCIYVTDAGVVTYVWQEPSTNLVKYFDGTQTLTLGPGAPFGAQPSLWDGSVAWIAAQTTGLEDGEVMFWKAGVTTQLTTDTDKAIQDDYPRVWNDLVVWQRSITSFLEPRLMVWDGTDPQQLTFTRSQYPSFHDGQVAWYDYVGGLMLADLVPVGGFGDCLPDGYIDFADFLEVLVCFDGPDLAPLAGDCGCADLDGDGDTDAADIAAFQRNFAP